MSGRIDPDNDLGPRGHANASFGITLALIVGVALWAVVLGLIWLVVS